MGFRLPSIAAMEKEEAGIVFMFILVAMTTAFIVFVVFYMIIGHKTRDIGIMKSVGVSSWSVVSIFLLFAGMVGIVGSVIGASAGCGFLLKINVMEDWLFEKYGFQVWNKEIYAIGEIPHDIEFNVIAVIVVCAIGAALLGAFVPAVQAGFKRPVEVLQVNQV